MQPEVGDFEHEAAVHDAVARLEVPVRAYLGRVNVRHALGNATTTRCYATAREGNEKPSRRQARRANKQTGRAKTTSVNFSRAPGSISPIEGRRAARFRTAHRSFWKSYNVHAHALGSLFKSTEITPMEVSHLDRASACLDRYNFFEIRLPSSGRVKHKKKGLGVTLMMSCNRLRRNMASNWIWSFSRMSSSDPRGQYSVNRQQWGAVTQAPMKRTK